MFSYVCYWGIPALFFNFTNQSSIWTRIAFQINDQLVNGKNKEIKRVLIVLLNYQSVLQGLSLKL